MNEETKPSWQSKGFWGGIIAAVASVALIFGIELDVAGLTEQVMGIVGLIGSVLAIIGRFGAKGPLRVL